MTLSLKQEVGDARTYGTDMVPRDTVLTTLIWMAVPETDISVFFIKSYPLSS